MDIDALAEGIETELRGVATPERAAGEKRYLKSDLDFLGATVPDIAKAAKRVHRSHPTLARTNVLRLVRRLWKPGIHELRMAAIEILKLNQDRLRASDLELVERLLRQAKTWALVDALAISVVGHLVEHNPSLNRELDRWAADDDFWIRRSALLALLRPLREGTGDFRRFSRYADSMLEEREFFIRKAIGWVLREAAKSQPEVVAAWVAPRTHRMSGVTIREAVKRLAPEQAAAYMAAYKAGKPAAAD